MSNKRAMLVAGLRKRFECGEAGPCTRACVFFPPLSPLGKPGIILLFNSKMLVGSPESTFCRLPNGPTNIPPTDSLHWVPSGNKSRLVFPPLSSERRQLLLVAAAAAVLGSRCFLPDVTLASLGNRRE